MTRHPSAPRSVPATIPPPGHEIADRLVLTRPDQVRALGHPLRTTILGLLTERAASVAELAEATRRPKGTIAHHVAVLHDAGLVQVVRTRRVRAVEERFYGRAARTVTISVNAEGPELPLDFNDFEVAARESRAAYEERLLWAFLRHARLTAEQASEFWQRLRDLVEEYDRLPRSGDTTYGLAVGIYPIPDYPTLPERHDPEAPDAG
ncbi:MAG TPA: helix-turn-helix domain-containing protein [Intrasporangium sp.]|uniref:helix-turn-helix domain-containing protein n=1 Tax=Intrasporangium sp. TaxID=1925024 RepID=UPI002B48AAF3|nr:helix-turn-helix domain-containing protein [Intrasporangium sp.]HKX66370.1 helix-turn-helix domain-containing protein [Intrasporangium sp.]